MSKDRMHYELLVQDAFRGVVKAALKRVADEGFPPGSNHHFFITFRTDVDGVELLPSLRAQYPEHMTIVLQNKFWDLKVDDEGFSVGLTFNQVPQTLRVPFSALVLFHDPSVPFQLPLASRANLPANAAGAKPGEVAAAPKQAGEPALPKPKKQEPHGEVVSLDAFRKK